MNAYEPLKVVVSESYYVAALAEVKRLQGIEEGLNQAWKLALRMQAPRDVIIALWEAKSAAFSDQLSAEAIVVEIADKLAASRF